MSRWKAASVHLLISAFVGLVSITLIFLVWYPRPYSHAMGADELVLLLMGVDLTLGPLLTLTVFRSGKKGLAFDLSVISLLQVAALIYGLSIVVRARPVFIVAAVDRFSLVPANAVTAEELAKAQDDRFRSLPWTGPKLVGSKPPIDAEEHNQLVFSGAAGHDIETMPRYYVEYPTVTAALLKRAKPLEALRNAHPEAAAPLASWLEERNIREPQVVWIPLQAPHASLTMLLDAQSGMPLDALPIDPW